MGHTGSALLPRSSPRQTTLATEVLTPLLPPASTLALLVFSSFFRVGFKEFHASVVFQAFSGIASVLSGRLGLCRAVTGSFRHC